MPALVLLAGGWQAWVIRPLKWADWAWAPAEPQIWVPGPPPEKELRALVCLSASRVLMDFSVLEVLRQPEEAARLCPSCVPRFLLPATCHLTEPP